MKNEAKPLTSAEAQAGIEEMEAKMTAAQGIDMDAWLEAQRRRSFYEASLYAAREREARERAEARQRELEAKKPAALAAVKAFTDALAEEDGHVYAAVLALASADKSARAKIDRLRALQGSAAELCKEAAVPFTPESLSVSFLRDRFFRIIAEALHDADVPNGESCIPHVVVKPVTMTGRPASQAGRSA